MLSGLFYLGRCFVFIMLLGSYAHFLCFLVPEAQIFALGAELSPTLSYDGESGGFGRRPGKWLVFNGRSFILCGDSPLAPLRFADTPMVISK